jgi:hypothetical protein
MPLSNLKQEMWWNGVLFKLVSWWNVVLFQLVTCKESKYLVEKRNDVES